MNIAQLAQELLDKNSGRVSVAVQVCVDNAKKPRPTPPSYEEYDEDDADVEDDEPAPADMKAASKKPTKKNDDEDEEDVYVDDLDEQYEIDLEGKKKSPKR